MSTLCNRLLPLIRRCHHDIIRNGIDCKVSSRFSLRQLSTGSGQGDYDGGADEGDLIKRKLEKAAKKITDKVGGKEGDKMKDSLMKMVSLHSEESKLSSPDAMKNISSILKDIPIEVSKKMTQGMDKKQDDKFTKVRKFDLREDKPRGWKESPPKLDFRSRHFDDKFQRDQRDGRDNLELSTSHSHQQVNFALAQPLNIFSTEPGNGDYYSLKVWKKFRKEEMDLEFRQPARNAFDEMIQLTREGKLWTFPIDNEAGLEEEAKVPFYEHVILDHLIEDLPPSAPVREFMELVLIGVSNNAFITVERKHALIRWYVEFFKEKEPVLRECGAL